MSVDAFNVEANGRRTHFYHQGVAAEMTPDDFDFSSTRREFCILDCPAHTRRWTGHGAERPTAGSRCCARRAFGLSANLELMTTQADRLAELGRPCLPHLDWLIVNDYEIGALAGRETRRPDGSTDPAAVARAIEDVLALGSMQWAAAHFPEGAIVGGRDGSRLALGSVALPASAIVRQRRGRRLRGRHALWAA